MSQSEPDREIPVMPVANKHLPQPLIQKCAFSIKLLVGNDQIRVGHQQLARKRRRRHLEPVASDEAYGKAFCQVYIQCVYFPALVELQSYDMICIVLKLFSTTMLSY